MAYGDYLPCCGCKEKLIYDGHWTIRANLEERYGTSDILCPKCLAAQRAVLKLAEPEDEAATAMCSVCGPIHKDTEHYLCYRDNCPTKRTV